MKKRTKLAHGGRGGGSGARTVNLPVTRASTVVFDDVAHMKDVQRRFDADEVVPTYGIVNMPLRAAFEELMVEIEGGHRAVTVGSGLAANAMAMMAVLRAGDHVLVTDSVYAPVRRLCDRTLKRYGIETTYYDPLAGASIAALMKPNTRAVYVETPGSYTMEVQDLPAIAAAAHGKGAAVIQDNTWATGLHYRSFEHGADLVVQAATKYPGGHSDVLIGSVIANEAWWPALRDISRDTGQTASPDDIYLTLRGLRTMEVRLRTHQASALEVAAKLAAHPRVKRVLHPALASDPGHALWKRDFTGAGGLFSIELVEAPPAKVTAFVEALELFSLGYSWGGFESLVVPASLGGVRSVKPWTGGPLVRLQIGLEDPADLIADLEQALSKLD